MGLTPYPVAVGVEIALWCGLPGKTSGLWPPPFAAVVRGVTKKSSSSRRMYLRTWILPFFSTFCRPAIPWSALVPENGFYGRNACMAGRFSALS